MKSTTSTLDLEDRIDRYLKGTLSQDDVDTLWVDVIQTGYVDYLKTAATVRKLATEREPVAVPIPLRHTGRLRTAAAAAAAVVVVGVGSTLVWVSTQPASVFQPLERIEYDVVRSTQPSASASQQAIVREATSLAALGDTQGALATLEGVGVSATEDVRLLRGIILYNEGAHSEALHIFTVLASEEGLTRETVEKAVWYAGNAAVRLGDTATAIAWLKRAIDMDGPYSRPAQSLLSSLSR